MTELSPPAQDHGRLVPCIRNAAIHQHVKVEHRQRITAILSETDQMGARSWNCMASQMADDAHHVRRGQSAAQLARTDEQKTLAGFPSSQFLNHSDQDSTLFRACALVHIRSRLIPDTRSTHSPAGRVELRPTRNLVSGIQFPVSGIRHPPQRVRPRTSRAASHERCAG